MGLLFKHYYIQIEHSYPFQNIQFYLVRDNRGNYLFLMEVPGLIMAGIGVERKLKNMLTAFQ